MWGGGETNHTHNSKKNSIMIFDHLVLVVKHTNGTLIYLHNRGEMMESFDIF